MRTYEINTEHWENPPIKNKYIVEMVLKEKVRKRIEKVFDDVEDWLSQEGEDDWRAWDSDYLNKYDELKKKHLQFKNGK